MKLRWSPLAVERAAEIGKYIALDDPSAAVKWIASVFGLVEQLESFPQSGAIVPETNREDIRQLVFGNYRIIYRIGVEHVSILTVRHDRQILPEDDLGKL